MSEISMEPYTDHEISMQQSSTKDVPGHDDKVLWEMINDGLQKYVTSDQDFARRSKSWSIYRVEQNLKKVHEPSTFHPKLVSIGPFHHKSDHLKPMEQHKWRFLSDFLKNSMDLTSNITTTTTSDTIIMTRKKHFLFASMRDIEDETRACYSETFDDLVSNDFIRMMILDGCFIIQLLLLFQTSGHNCRNADDPIYTWRSTLPYLRHDLLLMENQLPFTVLQKIFNMSGINKEEYKLTDLILDFFNPVLYREKMILDAWKQQLQVLSNNKDYCLHNHLLHLFMSSFQTRKIVHLEDQQVIPNDTDCNHVIVMSYFPEDIPNDTGRYKNTSERSGSFISEHTSNDNGNVRVMSYFSCIPKGMRLCHLDQDMSIHCVTELREAGVEFNKRDHHDLLDIEFKGGKLHIPTLFIDDNTVPILLNFIAYEQRHHSIKPYFTSYLMFLDYLVNSSKDVEHLHYKGIINHGLGSDEEVATLFNKLCKEVVQDLGDDNYLSPVFKDVNQHFGKLLNRWKAAWKHEYFRNPWAFSSLIAAIVLIVLTLLQTFFSMYAYFHPPSN